MTGRRYLGGFVGDGAAEKSWMDEKVDVWAESVRTLAGVACKHLQSAYDGLKKSLQQYWSFMQRVTPGIGDAFGNVEEVLWDNVLPALLQGLREGAPGRGFTRLPEKQVGLDLPDPTNTALENWMASFVTTGHLVKDLRGQVEFRTADHSACIQEGRTAVQKRSVLRAEKALAETIAGGPVQGARRL